MRTDRPCNATRGFTLVELLVTIAVIATLIALVLPGLGYAMGSARGFACQMSQRTTAFDFVVFADSRLHGNRGDDTGKASFQIETFQESQYGVDEFWRWGESRQVTMPDAQSNDPMRCPEVRSPLVLRKDFPCSGGAVGPKASVSFAFNIRLHRVERFDRNGKARAVKVRLRETAVDQAFVPLMFDGDGALAERKKVTAVYSGPSLDSVSVFARDRYWFPAMRHNGSANFAFLDGHVDSSATPLEEPRWDWAYEPTP